MVLQCVPMTGSLATWDLPIKNEGPYINGSNEETPPTVPGRWLQVIPHKRWCSYLSNGWMCRNSVGCSGISWKPMARPKQ